MNNQEVLLEQRPERVRRHPIIFFLLFWLIPISIPAWVIAYIESKAEKLKITKERIIYTKGIISKDEIEIPKEEIKQVTTNQGPVQRMLDVGEVSITTGGDVPETVINGFLDPDRIRKLARE